MKLPKICWVNVFDEMAYILIHWALIMAFAFAVLVTVSLAASAAGALAGLLA